MTQRSLLERLETQVRFGSSLLLVSGESGSGKTTLAEGLLDQADFANQAWIAVDTQNNDEQLRELLLTQLLNDPLFNAADPLFDSLSRNMDVSVAAQLIVIDDAERLSSQFIGELFELIEKYPQSYQHSLNIVLFSSQSGRQLAQQTDPALGQILEIDIPPLDHQESTLLAQQLFARAGYKPSVENKAAVEQRIESALGNPGAICHIVEEIISGAAIMSEEQAPKRKPYLLWGIVVVLVAAVAGLVVQVMHTPSQEPSETSAQTVSTGEANVAVPVALPTEKDQQAKANNPMPVSPAGAEQDQATELPKPVSEQTIDAQAAKELGQKRVVVDDEVVDELVKAQQQQDDTPAEKDEPATQPQTVAKAEPVTKPAPDKAKSAGAASRVHAEFNPDGTNLTETSHPEEDTQSVLQSKPAGHYTLQLGAFSSMQSADEFVQKNAPEGWTYPFQSSSRILYKVISGDYATRAAALTAQRQFKAKGQASLIKTFKQVQFELNK